MSNEKKERRAIGTLSSTVKVEHREEGRLPKIVGYTAVFDTPTSIGGWFNEVIRKGAFRRALTEKQDVRALFNHDSNNVLGRSSSGTLSMREDDSGLWVEIDPPDTSLGRDVVNLISRGDISGMSFAFIIRKVTWTEGEEEGQDLREILDVDLFDVGPVTYPAYEETTADVRSLDEIKEEKRSYIQESKTDSIIIPRFNGKNLEELVNKTFEPLNLSLPDIPNIRGISSDKVVIDELKATEEFARRMKIRDREIYLLTKTSEFK